MAERANLDWRTLTRAQAAKLVSPANQREQRMAKAYDRGEITEDEWWSAFKLWEDLRVYVICGEKPTDG